MKSRYIWYLLICIYNILNSAIYHNYFFSIPSLFLFATIPIIEMILNKNQKVKYAMLIIVFIICLIAIFYPFIKKNDYKINHCNEAYSCVKNEDGLYDCKYCSNYNEDTCIKEKEIKCDISDEVQTEN